MPKIQRALLSVSDKTGIVELGKALSEMGVEILSTGGTRRKLEEAGVPVRAVEDYTGFPEILDHRVVTLHPKVHGALLALRDKPTHMAEASDLGIEMIDMVVVNLYPFRETIAKPGVTMAEAVDNIDIGGPTMVRSAAKNYRFVSIVTDPADYPKILEEMTRTDGEVSEATNFALATKAFQLTARYDAAISTWLASQPPRP